MGEFAKIVGASRRIVFFGGAGVSAASGLPTFRGKGGLYETEFEGLSPEMILSRSFFFLNPEAFFRYYRQALLRPAGPNCVHRGLYALEQADRLRGIVTQNVDGLHRLAGNRRVYELHGSIYENECMDCGASYPMEFVRDQPGLPRCAHCGGVVRPGIVLYGEAPDKYTCMGACREISGCDTLIVAGTSLSVEPAASMIDYFHGKHLIVIDPEATSADARATLVLRQPVEQVWLEEMGAPD